ncbi:peptidase domain-containing ABC transporter [Kordia sp.]|uniref:peptidase domain-containing ABC transporter n=1 Tax=Kordia sp. TaxID=1965332 RepID=UPI003D27C2A6
MINRFPIYIQSEAKDCGPSCVKIVSQFYKKKVSIELLRSLGETTRSGTSLTGLILAAEKIGFRAVAAQENFTLLQEEIPLPCIAHWNQEHFVVVYKITKKRVYVSDPELGRVNYTIENFLKGWLDNEEASIDGEGIILALEPSPDFKEIIFEERKTNKVVTFLKNHLFSYKFTFLKIILLFVCTSALELVFPYITQQIIDSGVQNKDINFVYMACGAYAVLFLGFKLAQIVRNWIILKLSMKFNIKLISNFIKKLISLPISYFDSRLTGDLFQRVGDHDLLERFLTSGSIGALFSFFNVILFSGLFFWYDQQLFFIFFVGTIIHISWTMLFFDKRKVLDFKYFSLKSKENSKLIELINGMQDIKLNDYSGNKVEEWETIKTKLFQRDMSSLKVEQMQLDGASIISQLKNLLLILSASLMVIDGSITFGTLLAISYIIGHLNAPIERIVTFANDIQDVKLALRRISEIHHKDDESENMVSANHDLTGDIVFDNVSFKYSGTSKNVLSNLCFKIPYKKITALVGPSGCGKTTILKTILKFYDVTDGTISVGNAKFNSIRHDDWRKKCGVVLQEGFIFNDSIEKNIVLAEELDEERLEYAAKMAMIYDFIAGCPMKFQTKIGNEGVEVSTGQKQRILLARAIYRNPEYIFFDEATSALDAKNEKAISNNLNQFFSERTVMLIAHRLSTVRNADQIIVLSETGEIKEIGTHDELIESKGNYFELVKNQLELDAIN